MMWYYGLLNLEEEHRDVEDHTDKLHLSWPIKCKQCQLTTDTPGV